MLFMKPASLLCFFLFGVVFLWAEEAKPMVSAGPTPAMKELWNLLSVNAREKLGGDVNKLSPQGREFADTLLLPLDQRGVLTKTILEKNKDSYLALIEKRVPELRGYKIELPLGQPARDVGNPINWFIVPEGDIQWTQHLHYMYWVLPLCYSYYYNHNEADAEQFIDITLDWIRRFPDGRAKGLIPTPSTHLDGDGNPTSYEGSFTQVKPGWGGPWISLAAAMRADTWLKALQLIRNSPALTNDRTALILTNLLNQHRQNLLDFPRSMNQAQHIAVQLICLGTAFPEVPSAVEAGEIASKRYRNLIGTEIYLDGSFAECSPNYDVNDLNFLSQILQLQQRSTSQMDASLLSRFKKALQYFARTSDPLGRSPRIAKGGGNVAPFMERMIEIAKEPEAEFIATHGASGTPPPLCNTFSWSGHHTFRSGWESDATWLFFETGPRGSGHKDIACLNLQLMTGGQEFLSDPGYYSYSGAKGVVEYVQYLQSTAAHNIALVDGAMQIGYPPGTNPAANISSGNYSWVNTDKMASATGSYTYGYGPEGSIKVIQTRKVTYLKKKDAFQIEDAFIGKGQHAVELRWQIHPGIEVQIRNNGVDLVGNKRKVSIDFVSDRPLTIKTVKGQKDPICGWYSPSYGNIQESPVVTVSTEKGVLPLKIDTTITICTR